MTLYVLRRLVAGVVLALLVTFIIAISINLARGNAIDCGCFDPSASGKSYEERIQDMWIVIARDVGMLVMCLGVRRPEPPLVS